MKHELRIWPQYFARVADGSKTFEIRKNDRGFQLGDEVQLNEWDPELTFVEEIKRYTGKSLSFKIGYVHQLDAERCVFSLLPPQEKEV